VCARAHRAVSGCVYTADGAQRFSVVREEVHQLRSVVADVVEPSCPRPRSAVHVSTVHTRTRAPHSERERERGCKPSAGAGGASGRCWRRTSVAAMRSFNHATHSGRFGSYIPPTPRTS
jgi:hypothetical protein